MTVPFDYKRHAPYLEACNRRARRGDPDLTVRKASDASEATLRALREAGFENGRDEIYVRTEHDELYVVDAEHLWRAWSAVEGEPFELGPLTGTIVACDEDGGKLGKRGELAAVLVLAAVAILGALFLANAVAGDDRALWQLLFSTVPGATVVAGAAVIQTINDRVPDATALEQLTTVVARQRDGDPDALIDQLHDAWPVDARR